ncbi:MAG: hypothetical protein AYK22_00500 [Thermoplasmatales archaeon SG8-52-3]|nr:MAG: hypothetical protein AYK22_00500 [Thermoplasmatales archaeon SG8-52-3]
MNKKNNLLSKTLILSLTLLFIGASTIPNISGYENKTRTTMIKEVSSVTIDEDDYVNIFLKFDEGNGNTAGDSSGHDYDGTIYGASWTTGKYGYALDFDGTDDYIDLDEHTKNKLGINKTDDLYLSFYFRSSSTNRGIIYSMCRGDSYGYNPGFHVAITSEGKIEVQVWRLSCGVLTWSNNSYNDGSWHFVEIYYNGIQDNPFVKIVVDGDLDHTFKKYICDFFGDQFRYCQIGRHSHELIDYFDGTLDEFKIIKYPGGNEQYPPVVTGPITGQPGIEYDFTFSIDDPEGDSVMLYINWDDGNIEELGPFEPGEDVIVSHTWNVDGSYEIKAKCYDIWDDSRYSDIHLIRIGDQAPDRPIITGPKYGDPQEELTYTFVSSDYEGEDIKYYVDWGDGTTTETDYVPSNTEVELSHSFPSNNDYYMRARAIDIKNKIGEWEEYHIRIGDKPPNNLKIYGAVQGVPGVKYQYAFVAYDPEDDNLTYDIDWGDGDIETDIGPILSGEILVKKHSWNRTRNYVIKVRVKDEFDYYTPGWTEFDVIIPRSKVLNFNLLDLLFERLPYRGTIIKYLFKMIN